MADQTLTFLGWVRERIGGLATGQAGGRASGTTTVTLTGTGADGATTETATRELPFLLPGPADVLGLQGRAVVRRYPAPGTRDHESDRCPYVELAEPSLPWRYTPAPSPAASTGTLHPWFVLVVGVEGPELTLDGDRVTIETPAQSDAQALDTPTSAYLFAHVQVDPEGHRTARVLCGRPLQPGTDYLAVLVPAYDEVGNRSWTGDLPVELPAYDSWRFSTAVPAGSFEDLAGRLQPGAADPTIGEAIVRYPRLTEGLPDDDPSQDTGLIVRGALFAFTGGPPPEEELVPDAIATDLAALSQLEPDEQGRPIVTFPRYGDAWHRLSGDDGPTWARTINGDPRHRGVAGLGLQVGIERQEELVADALAHLGALAESRQRVRNLAIGVETTKRLWRRRVPADPLQRLWLLGPALGRLATERGAVADLATADDRTLPRGVFSAAARRVLRNGPARTVLAAAVPPDVVLAETNRQPPEQPSAEDGVSLREIGGREFDLARRQVLDDGRVNPAVIALAAESVATTADPRVGAVAGQLAAGLSTAAELGRPAPWAAILPALAAADSVEVGSGREQFRVIQMLTATMTGLRDRFDDRADDEDLTVLIRRLGSSEADDPTLFDVVLDDLANGVAAAFDPTAGLAPAAKRVLRTIDGIAPDDLLASPEVCVGLERAVWSDAEQVCGDWLLPGVGALPLDSVVSLQTNPRFVDAFLCGLNTQLLTELRWRNIPVTTGCTPLRRFWDRADTSSGDRVDDVIGIDAWTVASDLGNVSHQPPGQSGRDLVIAVRGALFLRYPATVVYLQSADHGGNPDFDLDPAVGATRVFPGFQGRLGADVAFFGFPGFDPARIISHWLVLEDPPSGYRFANDSNSESATAEGWAADALVMPVRVLIQGDALLPGG